VKLKANLAFFAVPLQAFHIGLTFIIIYEYYHWNGWRKKSGISPRRHKITAPDMIP